MPVLTVHLREGFFKTPVVIFIGGREVFRTESISTRNQIGLAQIVPVEVASGKICLRIEFTGVTRSIQEEIDATADVHVGVDIDERGNATVRIQSEEFHYL